MRSSTGRLWQLDVMRGVAVLLVLGRHLPDVPSGLPAPLSWLVDAWRRGGWAGVDFFFVLSGFLVSGLLFAEYRKRHDARVGRFLLRRAFKIYPAFHLLITVSVLVLLHRSGHVNVSATLAELFFVQNYFPGLWNHTWSLAIEEHFYLLLALGVWLATRGRSANPFRWLPAIYVAVALGCLGLRITTSEALPYSHETHLFPTHLRIDSLMFGTLLAYLRAFHAEAFERWCRPNAAALLIGGLILVSPAAFLTLEESFFLHTFGLTMMAFGFGGILLGGIHLDAGEGVLRRTIGYIGSHSYSIYLWHLPVLMLVLPWLLDALGRPQLPFAAWAAMYIVISIVFGIAMAELIELPVVRVRNRLFPAE